MVHSAIFSAVLAGLTAIFAKIGLRESTPTSATLVRTFVIIIVLSLFVC